MRTFVLLCAIFAVMCVVPVGTAQAGDREDIEALVHEYNRLDEVLDVTAQANLMTEDRIYILPGVRYTSAANQASNMKSQMASVARASQQASGNKTFITAVDPVIRVYGNAAVASFIRHTNFIPAEGPIPPVFRVYCTLVLVKRSGNWKIDLTQMTSVVAPAAN